VHRSLVVVILLSAPAWAQPQRDANAQWREKVRAAEQSQYDLSAWQAALKIAEPFGAGDVRLFETLVRVAALCSDEEQDCGPKNGGYLDRALQMRAQVKPADAHFSDLLIKLAAAASDTERYRDAETLYGEAREIREKLFGANDQRVADVYAAEAWVYEYQNDHAQARRTMDYALEMRDKAGAPKTEKYADMVEGSARLYQSAKDWAASEKEYRKALAIRGKLWKRADPRLAVQMKNIADQTAWRQNSKFSEEMYHGVIDLQKSVHSAKSKEYYQGLLDLANFLQGQKRTGEAEASFDDALQVSRQLRDQAGTADCLEHIARCRMDLGKYQQAAEAGEASLVARQPTDQASKRRMLRLYGLLSEAYLRAHDEKHSAARFTTLNERATANDSDVVITTADKLSTIYQDRGDYPHAAEKLEQELASLEMADLRIPNASNPQTPQKMLRLAQLYQLMGRSDDANRMNYAALRRVASQGMRASKTNPSFNQVLIALAVILGLMPVVGVVVFGFLYRLCARSVDRRLLLLHLLPAPEPIPAEPPPELPIAPGAEEGMVAVAAPPVTAPPGNIPVSKVLLVAEGDILFAIRVLNLLLSLLTLGTYSFWGKAKVRRYVCGQAEFEGDRFAFHGTGKELLLGWLRALPVLAFIFLFPVILPLWRFRYSAEIAQFSAAAAFLLLWPVARVGAYRYRLNRLSWRGIRFSYRGSALRYLGASLVGWLLSVITLGLYVPALQVRLRRLLFSQTYFGDHVFEFSGRAKDLLVAWLFALPLGLCSFGIGWAWWSALQHRYYWAHTTFAGARFRCTVTGRKLLWLWVGNFLIIVPTIGLGMSWAMLRTLRFWTQHIELAGEPEVSSIRQDARATSALGESFADFLGFDFEF